MRIQLFVVALALAIGHANVSSRAQSLPESNPPAASTNQGSVSQKTIDVEVPARSLRRLHLFAEQDESNTIVAKGIGNKQLKLFVYNPAGAIACEAVQTDEGLTCRFRANIPGDYEVRLENTSELPLAFAMTVARQTDAPTQSSTNSTPAIPTAPKSALVRIFYATDRKKEAGQRLGKMYGARRGEMQFGYCHVSIPNVHRVGEIERPSILRFEIKERADRHVLVREVRELSAPLFWKALSDVVSKSSSSATMVFVHGYNTTFEEAAWRSAQIVYDLRFDGAGVFFSWPSAGNPASYTVDEANVELSQSRLTRFFEGLARSTGAGNIYVIGHSMGTRALTRALAAAASTAPELRSRVKEIILSAPDIDAEVFKEQIVPALRQYKAPITLYASKNDRALRMSAIVHGYDRVGALTNPAVVLPGVETIVATGVETDFLGHSYFAQDRSILNDIYDIVNKGARPDTRFNLQRRTGESGLFWEFKP